MDHLQPRDGLLQLQNLDVALEEVPLVAPVAGVRPHLLRDERREPPQHLLVLLALRTCLLDLDPGGGGGQGGRHGAREEAAAGGKG